MPCRHRLRRRTPGHGWPGRTIRSRLCCAMDGIKNSRRGHHVLEKIIRAAIAHRWLVLLLVLGTTGLGIWNYGRLPIDAVPRSEEHTSELQSLMRISYAVFFL